MYSTCLFNRHNARELIGTFFPKERFNHAQATRAFPLRSSTAELTGGIVGLDNKKCESRLTAPVAAGVASELGRNVNSEIVASSVASSLGVHESTVQRYLDGSASMFERWQIDKRKLSRLTAEQLLRRLNRVMYSFAAGEQLPCFMIHRRSLVHVFVRRWLFAKTS